MLFGVIKKGATICPENNNKLLIRLVRLCCNFLMPTAVRKSYLHTLELGLLIQDFSLRLFKKSIYLI